MTETKKRMNPWVPVVIMGVVTILFGAYALQSQTELLDVQAENQQLKTQVELCERTAREQTEKAMETMKLAVNEAAAAQRALDDCKTNKRR